MIKCEFRKWITRDMVRNEREKLFVFGDNELRQGLGGQAKEMRGEPNSFGIATKFSPSMEPGAFFNDHPYAISIVLRDLADLCQQWDEKYPPYESIVYPQDGVGSGLAQLETRSPIIWSIIRNYETNVLGKK